ncbi:ribonuclease h2 subunit a [Anaeramoeba ignava]|uniref:Ribonuclease n=1 Tax=Anaeramoeba ignava TaxID=1746090 RepID=A0A9Q0LKT6_ANAIG|nr:ribonuclease h2 subunit a [Anaeramoeba ignava]
MKNQKIAYSLGIDESGRGCILGSMIFSSCACPKDKQKELIDFKVDDSKKLTSKQRYKLFTKIRTRTSCIFQLKIIRPEEISAKMLRSNKDNLNQISHDAVIHLISSACKSLSICEVFVDTVGPTKQFEQLLRSNFRSIPKIVVTTQADTKYAIVSAASICAKHTRDSLLRKWVFIEKGLSVNKNFGSGYLSESVVHSWLKENIDDIFGFPTIVRFSWYPTLELMKNNCVRVKKVSK